MSDPINPYGIPVWSASGDTGVVIDLYEICRACDVRCPAVQHAVKKLLYAGKRGGGKSRLQDLKEAKTAIERAIEMEELPK